MNRQRQFGAASAQQPHRHRDTPDVFAQPVLMTEAAATAFVQVFDHCKSPVRQFREWAVRQGVPVKRVGRRRLYDRRVLDAFLERQTWTQRHRPQAGGRRTNPAPLKLASGG